MKRFLIVLISCIVFTLAFVGGDRAAATTHATQIDHGAIACPCHMGNDPEPGM